ncbi:hypothetical protein GQ54DRAFT_316340 [Martensiomyces pterosporus]|nr:hypothetical protein GQ54DRAFT_316340 [Martensiomyces pterosporus]
MHSITASIKQHYSRSLSALPLLLLLLLHLSATTISAATTCNGHSELCDRPFNDVSFVSTHASFAVTNTSASNVPGTQYKGINQQLNDGVRGIHLNIVKGSSATEVRLCFPTCDVYNGGTLEDTLKIIKDWMDKNTNDVVTIFLEGAKTDADPAAVVSAFKSTGLDKYALQGKPDTWPTLSKMIDSGTRLVVFAEEPNISNANKAYFIPYGGIVLKLDGPFNYGAEWTCGPWNRSTESILLIPHFIQQTYSYKGTTYDNMPYPFNLGTTNGYQFEFHAITCRGGQSIWINFVEVDFYDQGDVWTPTLKFNALPYRGDDSNNFIPKFYSATVRSAISAATSDSLLLAVGCRAS